MVFSTQEMLLALDVADCRLAVRPEWVMAVVADLPNTPEVNVDGCRLEQIDLGHLLFNQTRPKVPFGAHLRSGQKNIVVGADRVAWIKPNQEKGLLPLPKIGLSCGDVFGGVLRDPLGLLFELNVPALFDRISKDITSSLTDPNAQSITDKIAKVTAFTRELLGQVMTFEVAGTWLAVPVTKVEKIVNVNQLWTVPLSAPEHAGLIDSDGELVPVLRFYPSKTNSCSKDHLVLVMYVRGESVGVLIDRPGSVQANYQFCDPDLHLTPPKIILETEPTSSFSPKGRFWIFDPDRLWPAAGDCPISITQTH